MYVYIAYIIYSYWLHYQARAVKSLQLNDLNNVLAILRFTPVWVRQGGYKYPWRVYPIPYPAMVRIRAPYTIYAIYVCFWLPMKYSWVHPLSLSLCLSFCLRMFFSTFPYFPRYKLMSIFQVPSGLGSIGRSAPVRASVCPFEAIAWRQFSAKCYSKYLADGRFSCFICGKFRILLMCSLSCASAK